MNSVITRPWIVKQLRKDDGSLNETVFVYPRGVRKPELPTVGREMVCAGVADVLYLSTQAVYLRDKAGGYVRLPWADIGDLDWLLRKVEERTVQAMRFVTADGRKIVVPMPFECVPYYFAEVMDACFWALTPSGKTCKLPGPARLKTYARPVPKGAPWATRHQEQKTVWVRELICPCGSGKGFALRYLGRQLKDGSITDFDDVRQRVMADCQGCGKTLELFDAYRHGYNAVICGEYKDEPPGRQAKTPYTCRCGKNQFSLGVVADYEANLDDRSGFRKAKRSEAYGWFLAYATCRSCQAVKKVVHYETA